MQDSAVLNTCVILYISNLTGISKDVILANNGIFAILHADG